MTVASRGLGRGIALTLAKEAGYIVFATGRNKSALDALKKEASFGSKGGEIVPYVLDQNDDVAVEQFVSNIAKNHDCISILVNSSYGGLTAMTPHFGKPFWDRSLSVYDEAANIGLNRPEYQGGQLV